VSAQQMTATPVDMDARWMYRVGGIAAVVLAIGYLVTLPLYASVGAPPDGGEAWLAYAAGKTATWWAILGLSVLTDLLFVPVACALFLALQRSGRGLMALATACVLLFVVLDLAVTWSNYAALISLADDHAPAATEARRAADVAAATYASAVLSSTLAGVYSIAILSLGILLTGLVMRRGSFGTPAAWLGIVTGALGIVSVVGPVLVGALGAAVIVASILTTAWVLVVGSRLWALGREPAGAV
jgi:hypothetical protein